MLWGGVSRSIMASICFISLLKVYKIARYPSNLRGINKEHLRLKTSNSIWDTFLFESIPK